MSTEPGHFGVPRAPSKRLVPKRFRAQPVSPPRFPPRRSISPRTPRRTWTPTAASRIRPGGNWNRRWRSWKVPPSALVFGSGMAAITAALRALTTPGSILVVPADGYYQVRAYASEYLAPQGITVVEARSADMYDAASDADVVLAETPANPGLDVIDLHRLSLICRAAAPRSSSTTPPRRRWGSCRCRWAPTWWWPARPRRCPATATCSPATWRAATPT